MLMAVGLFASVGMCEATGLAGLPTGRALLDTSGFLRAATGLGLTGLLLGCGFGWGLRLLGFTAVAFRAAGLA